ncbi:MAG: hypothetical protein ACREDD_07815 [Methylocella sp.]
MTDAKVEPLEKGQRDRSPSFPFIPLETAIERLSEFEAHHRRAAVTVNRIGPAWAMKAGTSQAQQTLAALKAYGLLESQRGPNGSEVSISEEGRTYLLAQQDSIKRQVLERAAIKPKQIELYWRKWGADRPKDAACLDALCLDGGQFSKDGAEKFLKVYDATIAFAKLSESDKRDQVTKGDDPPPLAVAVGDLVQIEIGGVFQLPQPACIRAIQDHEGKKWVFVEGSETGIPMEQAVVQAKGALQAAVAATPPRLPESKPEIAIQKNEREWLRGQLSKETTYRLIVTGDLGPKEIGKLIKLLTAQQAVLSDDEDEDEGA